MFRTLSELLYTVNLMIEDQGKDAPCAAFVFTKYDVFEYDEETNQENCLSHLITQDVLCDVGGSSYIYEQVGEMIDDYIRMRKKMSIYQDS